MDINSLNDAQKAALAKADASGVVLVHEGQTLDTKSATADVAPASKPIEKAPAAAPAKPTKPEGIPDKFWDAETGVVRVAEMARSYAELERMRSQPQQKPAEQKPADQAPPTMGEQKVDEQKPANQQQAPPIDPAVAAQEARNAAQADLARDGKISEDSYAKLAKTGFDRNTVDSYVAGQKAQQSLYLNALHDAAGGQEQFKAMVQWGATAYSPEESQAFDAAIKSGNTGTMKLAVEGLKARHAAEFGKASTTNVRPNPGSNNDTGGAFKTKAEVVAAMSDPRWTKGDPTYRAEVTAKIAAADRAGIDIGLYGYHSGRT